MHKYPFLLLTLLGLVGMPVSWAAVPPPARDAELQQCEPMRKEILRLNQKPRLLAPFYQPRVAWLKKRYGKCFQAIQTEEFKYLKQAEIPNHPGPKMPEPNPAKPAKKHWWWPWS